MVKKHPKKPSSPAESGYTLYGTHAVAAALANPNRLAIRLYHTQLPAPDLPARLQHHLPCEQVTVKTMEAFLPEGAVHQGIALLVKPLADTDLESWLHATLLSTPAFTLVILDQVVDPHNIGAILRSSLAFGALAVIVTEDHAPKENAVIAKTACGALESIPLIRVTNLARTLTLLKSHNIWCIGLDGAATHAIHTIPHFARRALILGAEGKGLRHNTQKHVDLLVKIEMAPSMESLNVSNAAAIALYALSLTP